MVSGKEINELFSGNKFGNQKLSDIPEKLTTFFNEIANYILPFLVVIALILAAGYIMFSCSSGWKKVIYTVIGAIIMFSSVGFLTYMKMAIEKDSGNNDLLRFLEIIFTYLKELTDGILPIASILSLSVGAGYIMFSNQSGWKRMINAIFGSFIGFGAVIIVNVIVKNFNTM